MSIQLISVLGLIAIFLIGTVRSLNLGVIGLVSAFGIGVVGLGMSPDDVLAGFPSDLFVILVGVTFLFAIASGNGTVDWLVHLAVRAVGGHVAAIPWIMFVISGLLVGFGAVSPAAVAIIAPIGMAFALRHNINPLMMGLMVVHGSAAGNFSPLGVLGVITNGIVDRSEVLGNPMVLFLSNLGFNLLLAVGIYFGFGGLRLLRERTRALPDGETESVPSSSGATGVTGPGGGGGGTTTAVAVQVEAPAPAAPTMNRDRLLTVVGLVLLVVGALGLGLDVGFTALSIAAVLAIVSPAAAGPAVGKISWSVVLLICGIVTYVGFMQELGTVEWLSGAIGAVGAPGLAALIVLYVGAVVSAFASTTGILGALIPLAVPLMAAGAVGPVALVAALAISSSVVDSSPFSTNGALVVANAGEKKQSAVYRQLMVWGFSLVILAPPITWLVLVLPTA